MADVTDRVSGFLCIMSTKCEKLVNNECKTIENTVKTDLKAIPTILRGNCSRSSPPGLSY